MVNRKIFVVGFGLYGSIHGPTDYTVSIQVRCNLVHATRQVCRPAEKTAGKKTTRHTFFFLTFMQTRDMYLHFTRSNIWANGNRYNFSSRVKTR